MYKIIYKETDRIIGARLFDTIEDAIRVAQLLLVRGFFDIIIENENNESLITF